MKFDKEVGENCVVIRPVVSRIDAIAAPAFRECVMAAATEHNSLVVVDLINVEFMDSSGLGAVIGAYKAVQETGGIALCSLHDDVKEVFTLTHMDRILDINADYESCQNSKAA